MSCNLRAIKRTKAISKVCRNKLFVQIRGAAMVNSSFCAFHLHITCRAAPASVAPIHSISTLHSAIGMLSNYIAIIHWWQTFHFGPTQSFLFSLTNGFVSSDFISVLCYQFGKRWNLVEATIVVGRLVSGCLHRSQLPNMQCTTFQFQLNQ